MTWLRRSRPAYAVDGVEPQRIDGWDVFDGDALAGLPAVTEAAARLPQDPTLEDLPGYLAVCTKDGREWTLSFDGAEPQLGIALIDTVSSCLHRVETTNRLFQGRQRTVVYPC